MITRNEMSLELLLLLAPEFEHGWVGGQSGKDAASTA